MNPEYQKEYDKIIGETKGLINNPAYLKSVSYDIDNKAPDSNKETWGKEIESFVQDNDLEDLI